MVTALPPLQHWREQEQAAIRLREAGPADAVGILLVMCEVLDEKISTSGYTNAALWELRLGLALDRLRGRDRTGLVVVGEVDGRTVGTLICERWGARAWYGEGIGVIGEWRDSGLGPRMLDFAAPRMRHLHGDRYYVDIEPWNEGSFRFSERYGFRPVEPWGRDVRIIRRVHRYLHRHRPLAGVAPDVAVRRARPQDVRSLTAMAGQRYDREWLTSSGFDAHTWRQATSPLTHLLDRIGKGVQVGLVAERRGEVAGGILASYLGVPYRVNGVVARDDDDGVALALYDALLRELRRRGVRRLMVEARADDAANRRWQELAGCEPYYRQRTLYRYARVERGHELQLHRWVLNLATHRALAGS